MHCLANEADTIAMAQSLAPQLRGGDCVALVGELGAGKSVFSRALLRALGVKDEALPSPTYAIIQPYEGLDFPVAHMDWYRLSSAEELLEIGVEEYLQPPWVAIIEWPQRAESLLPAHTYHITLKLDKALETRRWYAISGG
ncbi:MAG: tRNA (adenosine(37)-N6)-threonylcarbamoyltransferase complex ATPase subunit type 1 TsaE [Mariprofundales bacterium]|nr:tRNA (adenosine(37)-N6)-threonylcarbamoyltransferase complex ATPase subunit type 1 TsaE [Mariprofundales bacterium]